MNIIISALSTWALLASFPGLPHLQLLIASSTKTEGGGLGNLLTWYAARPSYIVTPHIDSQRHVRDRSCIPCYLRRWDKRQLRATPSVWSVPRLQGMTPKGCRVTNVKCPAMTQSSRGAKRRHYLEFHPLYHSYPSAVLLRTWICFTGRTYLFSETCFSFSSLSVAVDGNVNKPLNLESWRQLCRVSREKIPQAFRLRFRILEAIKSWRCGRPGNEARHCSLDW